MYFYLLLILILLKSNTIKCTSIHETDIVFLKTLLDNWALRSRMEALNLNVTDLSSATVDDVRCPALPKYEEYDVNAPLDLSDDDQQTLALFKVTPKIGDEERGDGMVAIGCDQNGHITHIVAHRLSTALVGVGSSMSVPGAALRTGFIALRHLEIVDAPLLGGSFPLQMPSTLRVLRLVGMSLDEVALQSTFLQQMPDLHTLHIGFMPLLRAALPVDLATVVPALHTLTLTYIEDLNGQLPSAWPSTLRRLNVAGNLLSGSLASLPNDLEQCILSARDALPDGLMAEIGTVYQHSVSESELVNENAFYCCSVAPRVCHRFCIYNPIAGVSCATSTYQSGDQGAKDWSLPASTACARQCAPPDEMGGEADEGICLAPHTCLCSSPFVADVTSGCALPKSTSTTPLSTTTRTTAPGAAQTASVPGSQPQPSSSAVLSSTSSAVKFIISTVADDVSSTAKSGNSVEVGLLPRGFPDKILGIDSTLFMSLLLSCLFCCAYTILFSALYCRRSAALDRRRERKEREYIERSAARALARANKSKSSRDDASTLSNSGAHRRRSGRDLDDDMSSSRSGRRLVSASKNVSSAASHRRAAKKKKATTTKRAKERPVESESPSASSTASSDEGIALREAPRSAHVVGDFKSFAAMNTRRKDDDAAVENATVVRVEELSDSNVSSASSKSDDLNWTTASLQ